MDNHEARFILQAYRPGGQDAADPEFAAALDQARQDPELGRWFAEEQALDAAVAGKLQAAPVPVGLKANILAGRKVVSTSAWTGRRQFLALAAGIVALLSAAWLWQQHRAAAPATFTAFHTDMIASMDHITLDLQTDDMTKIRHWLKSRRGHSDLVLPASLDGKPGMGCCVLDWRNKKVSLICYYLKQDGSEKLDELHLLVVDRDALSDPPPLEAPRYSSQGRWETASWSDERHSYVLAGLAQGSYLRSYFNP
jgi:hypothetical protein